MSRKVSKPTIRIELTSEQREQIRQAIGREVTAIELTAEALEERVTPVMFNPKEYILT